MIFYFTGTGNSLYAAQKLADEGEKIVSIVDALRSKAYHYTLNVGEKLGFVFPVYFYTVSDPVLELVRKLTVENAGFVYAVIPCGASIGAAGGLLKSELKKRGLELQRVDALFVPDGALIFYDIDSPDKMEKQLEAATKELASIKQAIDRGEGNSIKGRPVMGRVNLAAYHACMSTRAFYADEKCIGCGKCASICPAGAIEMVGGSPVPSRGGDSAETHRPNPGPRSARPCTRDTGALNCDAPDQIDGSLPY